MYIMSFFIQNLVKSGIMSNKELEMKEIGVEYLDQYNQLLKYVFQVTESELSQSGWEEEEDFIRAKAPNLEKADAIGWFDKDNLVSQVIVYPMKVRIFNHTFNMGGLTGVGTYPEYSGNGLMNKLLFKALSRMREKKQFISYLYPYSIPYYRRKGWEIVSDKITYEINDYQLPKDEQIVGKVRRVDPKGEEIKTVYNKFSNVTHGALVRDDISWNEYWLWENEDIMTAVYYNEKDELEGYLVYWISDEIFYIKEMIFLNENARKGLWNFVSAHFSMIKKVIGNTYTDEPLSFLFEDADIKESISPYFMARIVDFEKFIEEFPFKKDNVDKEWVFKLEDPLLSWNDGVFHLYINKEGQGKARLISEKTEDRIDIQTMTTMLLGYKRPDYLYRIGRIKCSMKTINDLEDSIEKQVPYFSDYF